MIRMKHKEKIKKIFWVLPMFIVLGAVFGILLGSREHALKLWLYMGTFSGVLAGLAALIAFSR